MSEQRIGSSEITSYVLIYFPIVGENVVLIMNTFSNGSAK